MAATSSTNLEGRAPRNSTLRDPPSRTRICIVSSVYVHRNGSHQCAESTCAAAPSVASGRNGLIGSPEREDTVPQADNYGPVDRARDRLRSPTSVQDRLGVLQQLVDIWHGPIEPEDGLSDAELAGLPPLPLPLRWWYRWAGKRTEVMSGQNFLFEPRREEQL